jgi:hypothetical protein
MKRLAYSIVFLAAVVLTVCSLWPSPIDRAVRAIERSADGRHRQWEFRKLFRQVGPEGVAGLKAHPNDTIAIQSAWEEVLLPLPKEAAGLIKVDQARLEAFVQFLESRAQVTAPAWWRGAVVNAYARSRDEVIVGRTEEFEYERQKLELHSASAPPGTTLAMKDGRVVLSAGADAVVIPEESVRWVTQVQPKVSRIVWGCYSALFTPTHCYLAAHDNLGSEFDLSCIERATGKLAWKSKVFGCFWWDCTGQYFSKVSIVDAGDRVVVFGIGIGMYVEAFNKSDGKNLFRFSSSYGKDHVSGSFRNGELE